MKLFIDDLRQPPQQDWMVVRNYKEAILWFRTFKCPSKISFDHDLGIGENGYDILKWLFDYDLENDYIKQTLTITVHSANVVGKTNIVNYIYSYRKMSEKNIFLSDGY